MMLLLRMMMMVRIGPCIAAAVIVSVGIPYLALRRDVPSVSIYYVSR